MLINWQCDRYDHVKVMLCFTLKRTYLRNLDDGRIDKWREKGGEKEKKRN